tara:strand:+ start:1815 stop:2660 length:846 start_codon:yes stop_codon:yes gene_type:complete
MSFNFFHKKRDAITTQIPGNRYSTGFGYVALPKDIDKQEYVNNCLRSNSITLLLENGGWIDNVPVAMGLFNYINFPDTPAQLGSQVVYSSINLTGWLFITAVLPKSDEAISYNEYQFVNTRMHDNGFVGIVADAFKQFINITVSSAKEKIGSFNLTVSNKDKTAKLNVRVKGSKNTDIEGSENKEILGTKTTTVDGEYKIKVGEHEIEIAEDGITIYSGASIDIVSETSTISLDDAGINIDAGENPITVGGNHEVLYSKIPLLTEIVDVSQIGVSTKVKVG